MKKVIYFASMAFCLIYLVLAVMAFSDYWQAHEVYQRVADRMYTKIEAGEDYGEIKKTAAYLQGSATRKLNNAKWIAVHFAIVCAGAAAMFYGMSKDRKAERGVGDG